MGWIVASAGGLVAMAAGLAGLILNWSALATGPIGLTVQVAAVAVMIWARQTFGLRSFHATANPTGGGLVTSGPYRFLRHPIYAAVLWFTWAGALSHPSATNAASAVVGTVGAAVRIAAEERLLRARYPDYAAYATHTRRIIPYVF